MNKPAAVALAIAIAFPLGASLPLAVANTPWGKDQLQGYLEQGTRILMGTGTTQYVRWGLDGYDSPFGTGCYAIQQRIPEIQADLGLVAKEWVRPAVIRDSNLRVMKGNLRLSATDLAICNSNFPSRWVPNTGDGLWADLMDADAWQKDNNWTKIGKVHIWTNCQNMSNRVRAPNWYLAWGQRVDGTPVAGAAQCEVQEPPTDSGS